MRTGRFWIVGLVSVMIVSQVFAAVKLGDESDGSRTTPVHLMPLFDVPIEGSEPSKILSSDEYPRPFSQEHTCGDCHTVSEIAKGWHFNAADPNVDPGRPGQCWIYADASIATQIPLSYRNWKGAYHPEQIGMSPWQFTKTFGRHFPGGGPGKMESDVPEEAVRQFVSGKLEMNCLACHNASYKQDQSEYALQIARENMQWAGTAASGIASVSGTAADMGDMFDPIMDVAMEGAPKVTYHEGVFDHKSRVYFDISLPTNNRCYFCHSNFELDREHPEKWLQDEDVHLTSGMQCIDCHRNGLDHNIIRGYEGEQTENPLAKASTCEGCHLGTDEQSKATQARMGAPVPTHPGIPTIHFDKLTCTACHSGPWPEWETMQTKTSRAHRLGTKGVIKENEVLPRLQTVVFATNEQGKIAPHKAVWPVFWGWCDDGEMQPLHVETIRPIVSKFIESTLDVKKGHWPQMDRAKVAEILKAIEENMQLQGQPIYVAGGQGYRLNSQGELFTFEHEMAEPYLWPIAHNVRGAGQSLGVRSCGDCHSLDAPFNFGTVKVDTPVLKDANSVPMYAFQDIHSSVMKVFAFTFVFRPFMKFTVLACCALIAFVLFLYALRALRFVVRIFVE